MRERPTKSPETLKRNFDFQKEHAEATLMPSLYFLPFWGTPAATSPKPRLGRSALRNRISTLRVLCADQTETRHLSLRKLLSWLYVLLFPLE